MKNWEIRLPFKLILELIKIKISVQNIKFRKTVCKIFILSVKICVLTIRLIKLTIWKILSNIFLTKFTNSSQNSKISAVWTDAHIHKELRWYLYSSYVFTKTVKWENPRIGNTRILPLYTERIRGFSNVLTVLVLNITG